MTELRRQIFAAFYLLFTLALVLAPRSVRPGEPLLIPGNLVVVVEGCGVYGGACTSVANGNGSGVGNSSVGGYGDNEAAPLTLFQYAPTGAASATYVNSLVLPQAGSGANFPVSGEYGSSSEGTLQLSGGPIPDHHGIRHRCADVRCRVLHRIYGTVNCTAPRRPVHWPSRAA